MLGIFPLLFLYHYSPSFSSFFSQSYFALLFALSWYINKFYWKLELVPSKIAVIQEILMCKNSSTNSQVAKTPLSGMDKVRGKNNTSSKLPDQSEGSGRTWLLFAHIKYTDKLHFTITRTTQKLAKHLLPPEGQCCSALSSSNVLMTDKFVHSRSQRERRNSFPRHQLVRADAGAVLSLLSLLHQRWESRLESKVRCCFFPFSLMAGLGK